MRAGRRHPDFVLVSRTVLLNGALSPTSRLLYATLLASLEPDIPTSEVAALVGVGGDAGMEPFLEELTKAGAVEVVHENGSPTLVVHGEPQPPQAAPEPSPMPDPAPWEYRHECPRPCEVCGRCACGSSGGAGMCKFCLQMRQARRQGERDIARWKAQLDAGAVYSLGHKENRLHRWDCHTLHNPEKALRILDDMKPEDEVHGAVPYWQWLPQLLTAEEVRTRRQRPSCQLCKPDI